MFDHTITGAPGFLNSPPTIFLREDGMFVAVGDTTIPPATTLDLAETSEYTFTKGGFVPSTVDFTAGMMVTSDPAGGTATFTLSGTVLTAGGTADNFEADNTPVYSLPITALNRADSLAAHYLLTANLDFDTDDSDTVDSSDTIPNFDPIGDCGGDNCGGNNDNDFTGGFDGGGNTIANLTINRSSLRGVGLFAITNGVSIRNLFLQDVNIAGNRDIGGLVGYIRNILNEHEFFVIKSYRSSSLSNLLFAQTDLPVCLLTAPLRSKFAVGPIPSTSCLG